jgi:hypothetical protein
MKNERVDVPCSAADDAKDQSISSADQKGNVIEAQPTIDFGIASGVGHAEGDGPIIKWIETK